MAKHFGLAHSCGSDFHGVGTEDYDLGHYPFTDVSALKPVWDLLESRIMRPYSDAASAVGASS